MGNLSVSSYAPCYHLDLSAKKVTMGKYDYSKLVAQQSKMAEEERNNPQIGTATLTEQEIQDFAGKYNPTNMTNAEYNGFIKDLVYKGVLGRSEIYGVHSDRVVLRPGHLSEGGITSSPVRTLADMKGDALQWTSTMSQWRGGSFDKIRADAFQKIANILEEMNTYTLDQENAAEDAAKAAEQQAAVDRAAYEQRYR